MSELLAFDELAVQQVNFDDLEVDLVFEDTVVSPDGGNVATAQVFAEGANIAFEVSLDAWDGGSSASGHLEVWA